MNLGYEHLPFPSITICNINPIRYSKLPLATDELKEFYYNLTNNNEADGEEVQVGDNQ